MTITDTVIVPQKEEEAELLNQASTFFARHIHRLQSLEHLLSYGGAPPPLPHPQTLMHYHDGGEISISLSNKFTDNASKRRRRHSF